MIAITKEKNNAKLWHHMLGHMSQKGMNALLSKGKLADLKLVYLDIYESCILGK